MFNILAWKRQNLKNKHLLDQAMKCWARGLNHNPEDSARCCYNHIAGRLGVLVKVRLVALDVLLIRDEAVIAGSRYRAFLEDLGIEPPSVSPGKSPAKLCLDWTEQR